MIYMAEIANIYRISGYYIKVKTKIPFIFECRAYKVENALEKVFSELGSRHRVKRDRIFIERDKGIKTINAEDARNPEFLDMNADDFVIYR